MCGGVERVLHLTILPAAQAVSGMQVVAGRMSKLEAINVGRRYQSVKQLKRWSNRYNVVTLRDLGGSGASGAVPASFVFSRNAVCCI
jgi:hypothetical protein